MSSKKQRIKKAIEDLVASGASPTSKRISLAMGRSTPTLNGRETAYRREVLSDLQYQMASPRNGRGLPVQNSSIPDNNTPENNLPDTGIPENNLPDTPSIPTVEQREEFGGAI